MEGEEKKRRLSKDSMRKATRIYKYIKPYWLSFTIGIVMITLSGVFTLLVTRLWGQLGGVGVQDAGAGADVRGFMNLNIDFTSLSSIGVAIAILLVVQAAISFTRVILFARVTENMMLALRKDTYEKVIRMPMQYFNEKRVGDINSRISADITSIQDVFTTTLAELLRQLIIIVGGILALLYFSPTLTFIMLGTLPVMIIVAIIFGRYVRKLSKLTQDKVSESNVIVQETLTGIVNVKSFANEFLEMTRYIRSVTDIRAYALKGALWRGVFASFIILFIFGAISLIIFKGADLMTEGDLAKEHFFTFLLMTGLVAGSIGGIASQFGVLQKGIGAIENVMDILDLTPEDIDMSPAAESSMRLQGDIAFKDVNFQYASREEIHVIKDLNFMIKAGQQVALVGPSGAGKSTIASLIQHFYVPVSGEITFDDKDARSYELTALRRQMAYVPQEVLLFGGSIRENIAYGKPTATDDEIRKAAQQANAMEFIARFPDGLDTLVGERGIQLSGGQRQRIAIARAVLKDPTILILDEATSSLDSESERLVQEALDKLMIGRTSIVIAHRLSTIRNADLILVLEDGALKESGTHSELIAMDGLYTKLVNLQQSNR
ncbi:MAG: ATP-binding cassette domain-containing protein [Cryomorphaceae bacterium]|nr:ATP-binding cassette domain-containing protein [Cryomorphaceae bacterium]